jgi:acyl CoA:acetate/3-ketoacid CoA transferase alpha subunit
VIRRFSKKVFEDVEEALKVINSGNKILVGGFGLCGIPLESLENLSR